MKIVNKILYRATYSLTALVAAPVVAIASESNIDLPAVATAAPRGHSIMDLVTGSGPVVQGVLILLVVLSVITWGIAVQKWMLFGTARRQTEKFSNKFWTSKNFDEIYQLSQQFKASPVATVYSAGHRELLEVIETKNGGGRSSDFGNMESIERALKRAKAEEVTHLEQGTTFLATTASAAPFIGLFGTVWGIMNAFIGLAQVKTTSIQAVAPGISEALIATAIGLAAAIPAAIAYNYFAQQIRVLSREMDMFSAEFLNIANRYFLK